MEIPPVGWSENGLWEGDLPREKSAYGYSPPPLAQVCSKVTSWTGYPNCTNISRLYLLRSRQSRERNALFLGGDCFLHPCTLKTGASRFHLLLFLQSKSVNQGSIFYFICTQKGSIKGPSLTFLYPEKGASRLHLLYFFVSQMGCIK